MPTKTHGSFKSVDSTTSTGAGTAFLYRDPVDTYMFQVVGGSNATVVSVEGSLDGSNWYTVVAGSTLDYVVSSSTYISVHVRANITTATTSTGGASVWIAAK